MSRIVVGIDGSDSATRALQWAVDEARLRGAVVEAVYAYEYTPSWQRYGYAEEVGSAQATEYFSQLITEEAEKAEARARTLAERVTAEVESDGVTVHPTTVQDRPVSALVDRSQDSDLLVVGSRGRGGFTGLLLGSVSQQCAQHAHCPVVILPHRD